MPQSFKIWEFCFLPSRKDRMLNPVVREKMQHSFDGPKPEASAKYWFKNNFCKSKESKDNRILIYAKGIQ